MADTEPNTQLPAQASTEFDWRSWVLVGAIAISFLLVPAVVLLSPPTGFSFTFAYLILPMIPAIGLGIIAVWSSVDR